MKAEESKASIFKELHKSGTFVMANAWNAGSAKLLADCGFAALGTTSAGIAYSAGVPDQVGCLGRERALAETNKIVEAVDLPISADTENCYGDAPEVVAETVRFFIEAGVVGVSIEDLIGDVSRSLYALDHAIERVRAARSAIDASGIPVVLTARAECFTVNHPAALSESIRRVNFYRDAGADCLFVPGVTTLEEIKTLVKEIDGPLSVVMGLGGTKFTVKQLSDIGVRRISIGGSLARATFHLIKTAAEEIVSHGTFSYADDQLSGSVLNRMFDCT